MADPVHFGIGDASYAPAPEDDLDDLELGERVTWEMLMWRMALAYSAEEARIDGAVTCLIGPVGAAMRAHQLPFPKEWWPVKAGPFPDDLRRSE